MITIHHQSDKVKTAAEGHWLRILPQLTILNSAQLDGGNYPCPSCGGSDRFNACRKSFEQSGQVFCNKDCGLTGDGFAVLMHLNSWDFVATVSAVDEFLMTRGATSANKRTGTERPKRTTNAALGMSYPDAVTAVLRGVRRSLTDHVTIADEPTTYDYQDATGRIVGVVLRWDRSDGQKEIRQLSITADGVAAKAMPSPRPLFNLPSVMTAEVVYLVEGEKAVAAVESFGLVATTSSGGSNAADNTDWSTLNGKRVIICRDQDSPGEKYRDKVAGLIHQQAPSATVCIAELSECWPEIPAGGDAADWSEKFDGQPNEWFCQQLENITKPFTSVPVSASTLNIALADEWPDLIPFDDPDLLRLDVSKLPVCIRDMVQQVSEHSETPPEMATMVALGATATAAMRKFNIEIEPGFRQPLNLYLCAVMPPGNRKSAVFRRMFEPVEQYEKIIRQAAESEFQRTSADREIWERQCSDLKTKISKAEGDEATDMRRELDHLLSNAPEVLNKPQLVSDDVTPESVCTLLSQNFERLGIASAEPEVFDLIMGRYSKGPNLGLWLKGHDGDRHTENRRNRPEPIVLNSPLLTMTIMAQPEAIQTAGSHRVMRGRGMLDRFLFALPPSPVGLRSCISSNVEPHVERAYQNRLQALLSVKIPVDEYGGPSPRLLTMASDAHKLWKAEQIRIERLMADSEPLSMIAGWGSKFAAQVIRIAANLHLIEYGDSVSMVNAATMEQAIHIGRFIESHTRAVFQAMGHNPAIVTAKKVARKIVSEQLTEVSRRDVMRFDRTIDVTDAQTAIELMVEHGYLVAGHSEKRKGRPSDKYRVNPAIF